MFSLADVTQAHNPSDRKSHRNNQITPPTFTMFVSPCACRAISELYTLCEYDSNELWALKAVEELNGGILDFSEVRVRSKYQLACGRQLRNCLPLFLFIFAIPMQLSERLRVILGTAGSFATKNEAPTQFKPAVSAKASKSGVAWQVKQPPSVKHKATPQKVASHQLIKRMLDRMTEDRERIPLSPQFDQVSASGAVSGSPESAYRAATAAAGTPVRPAAGLQQSRSAGSAGGASPLASLAGPPALTRSGSNSADTSLLFDGADDGSDGQNGGGEDGDAAAAGQQVLPDQDVREVDVDSGLAGAAVFARGGGIAISPGGVVPHHHYAHNPRTPRRRALSSERTGDAGAAAGSGTPPAHVRERIFFTQVTPSRKNSNNNLLSGGGTAAPAGPASGGSSQQHARARSAHAHSQSSSSAASSAAASALQHHQQHQQQIVDDRPAPVLLLLSQLQKGGLAWGDWMLDEDNNNSMLNARNKIDSATGRTNADAAAASQSGPASAARTPTRADAKHFSTAASPIPASGPSDGRDRTAGVNSYGADGAPTGSLESESSTGDRVGSFGFSPSLNGQYPSSHSANAPNTGASASRNNVSPASYATAAGGGLPIGGSAGSSASAVGGGPGYTKNLHQKLSSPERQRPSPQETARRTEQRQAAAEAKRLSMQEEKMQKLQEREARVRDANQRVQAKHEQVASFVNGRLKGAEVRHNEAIKQRKMRAENDLMKVTEITYIQRQELENKKVAMNQQMEGAERRRTENMQKRLGRAVEHGQRVTESLQARKQAEQVESQQKREEIQKNLLEHEARRQAALATSNAAVVRKRDAGFSYASALSGLRLRTDSSGNEVEIGDGASGSGAASSASSVVAPLDTRAAAAAAAAALSSSHAGADDETPRDAFAVANALAAHLLQNSSRSLASSEAKEPAASSPRAFEVPPRTQGGADAVEAAASDNPGSQRQQGHATSAVSFEMASLDSTAAAQPAATAPAAAFVAKPVVPVPAPPASNPWRRPAPLADAPAQSSSTATATTAAAAPLSNAAHYQQRVQQQGQQHNTVPPSPVRVAKGPGASGGTPSRAAFGSAATAAAGSGAVGGKSNAAPAPAVGVAAPAASGGAAVGADDADGTHWGVVTHKKEKVKHAPTTKSGNSNHGQAEQRKHSEQDKKAVKQQPQQAPKAAKPVASGTGNAGPSVQQAIPPAPAGNVWASRPQPAAAAAPAPVAADTAVTQPQQSQHAPGAPVVPQSGAAAGASAPADAHTGSGVQKRGKPSSSAGVAQRQPDGRGARRPPPAPAAASARAAAGGSQSRHASGSGSKATASTRVINAAPTAAPPHDNSRDDGAASDGWESQGRKKAIHGSAATAAPIAAAATAAPWAKANAASSSAAKVSSSSAAVSSASERPPPSAAALPTAASAAAAAPLNSAPAPAPAPAPASQQSAPAPASAQAAAGGTPIEQQATAAESKFKAGGKQEQHQPETATAAPAAAATKKDKQGGTKAKKKEKVASSSLAHADPAGAPPPGAAQAAPTESPAPPSFGAPAAAAAAANGTASAQKAAPAASAAKKKKMRKLRGQILATVAAYAAAVGISAASSASAVVDNVSSALGKALSLLRRALPAEPALQAAPVAGAGNDDGDEGANGAAGIAVVSTLSSDAADAVRDLWKALEGRSSSSSSSSAVPKSVPASRGGKASATASAPTAPASAPSFDPVLVAMVKSHVLSSTPSSSSAAPGLDLLFKLSGSPPASAVDASTPLPVSVSDVETLRKAQALQLVSRCLSRELLATQPRSVAYAARILALLLAASTESRETALSRGMAIQVVDVCSQVLVDLVDSLPSVVSSVSGIPADSCDARLASLVSLLQSMWLLLKHESSVRASAKSLEAVESSTIQYMVASGLVQQVASLFQSIRSLESKRQEAFVPLLQAGLGVMISIATRPAVDGGDAFASRPVYAPVAATAAYQESFVAAMCEGGGLMSDTLLIFGGLLKAASLSGKLDAATLTTITLAMQTANAVCRLDLKSGQKALVGASAQPLQEACLLLLFFLKRLSNSPAAASSQLSGSPSDAIDTLLHEVLLLLGYACLDNPSAQAAMRDRGDGSGSGGSDAPSVLHLLCALPYRYFSEDSPHRHALFPTMIAVLHGNEGNKKIASNEMSLQQFVEYLQQQATTVAAASSTSASSASGAAAAAVVPSTLRVSSRFPVDNWPQAIAFLQGPSAVVDVADVD